MTNNTNIYFITCTVVHVTPTSKVYKGNRSTSEMLTVTMLLLMLTMTMLLLTLTMTMLLITLVMVSLPQYTLPCTSHGPQYTYLTANAAEWPDNPLNTTLATHYATSNVWFEMQANY